jgi:hypothetical protein
MSKHTEKEQADLVRIGLATFPHDKYVVEANVGIVLRHVTPETEPAYFWVTIADCETRGELLVAHSYDETFNSFFAGAIYQDNFANRKFLDDELVAQNMNLNVDNLAYVAGQPNVSERLAKKQSAIDAENKIRWDAEKALQDEQDRAKILATLIQWFENAKKHLYAHDAYSWQNELKSEMRRITSLSVDQLRTEFATRTEKRRLAAMSRGEIRAEATIAASSTPRPVQAGQYPSLPEQYTRQHLLEIANADRYHFRHLVSQYGSENVNGRLAGRS